MEINVRDSVFLSGGLTFFVSNILRFIELPIFRRGGSAYLNRLHDLLRNI